MKKRIYSMITVFTVMLVCGFVTISLRQHTTTVYAKEEQNYIFNSEDTITIYHSYKFAYYESIPKDQLSKVEHIILEDNYADLDDFTMFDHAKTLSLSESLLWLDFKWREKDVLPSLTEIDVDAKNPNFTSQDGVLYAKNGERLLYYPANHASEAKVAPNTRFIGRYAFKNVPITSIEIPEGVVYLEEESFAGTNLSTITLPASFRSLSSDAFLNAPLTQVQISK